MARGSTGTVIFDLDGTLIESEEIWEAVRHAFVVAHGGQWRDDAQSSMIGMRTAEWANYIREDLHVALPAERIAREVVAAVAQRIGNNVPVLPGAEGALERLSRDFRLALATSAALPVAQAVLSKTGWMRFFPVVVSADDVARGKPAPDVYLRALELMNADPADAAAVEDSGNGIRSARNAQLAVIAIPNRTYPPAPDALAQASRVVNDLNELDSTVVRAALR